MSFSFSFSSFLSRSDTFPCVCLTEGSGINIFCIKFWVGSFYKTEDIIHEELYCAVAYAMHYIVPSPHCIHM